MYTIYVYSKPLYYYQTDIQGNFILDQFGNKIPKDMPLLKIGDTTREVEIRVGEQDTTSNPEKLMILYQEETSFRDYEVHKFLERPDVDAIRERSNREWFKCSLNTVKSSINKLKTGSFRPNTFSMRDEQCQAVDSAVDYFSTTFDTDKKFLWNAKMRFGKTFSAYQLMKKLECNKTLILTYKPAIWHNWEYDLNNHIDFEGYDFIRAINHSSDNPIDLKLHFKSVVFCSFQDLLQKYDSDESKIKEKFKYLLSYDFDLLIIDEVHFGADSDKARNVLSNIKCDKTLYLSGTPFKLLSSDQIGNEQVFSWSYIDEQNKRKKELELLGEEECKKIGQYYYLPQMTIFGNVIPKSVVTKVMDSPGYNDTEFFTFTKFFKSDEKGNFIHSSQIDEFLNSLIVSIRKSSEQFKHTNISKHSFWVLSHIAECKAMYEKLKSHSYFKNFKIIVAAGDNMKQGNDHVKLVIDSINEVELGLTGYVGTITLSCGKLTTGVTIPKWNSVFMLNDMNSTQEYFQTIFRCQSSDKQSNKTECVVFDFNPDRLLKTVYQYSKFNCSEGVSPLDNVKELLKVINILCLDGTDLAEITDDDIFDSCYTGGMTRSILAKKFSSKNLLALTINNMSSLSTECLKILDSVVVYKNRTKNQSIQLTECDLCGSNSSSGGASSGKKSKEDKELQSAFEVAQNKLLKIVSTLPRFVYLSEFQEGSTYDIITCYEKELFEEICGISGDDMKKLFDSGVFNISRLDDCIVQLRRFEESSIMEL